jgi:hypothetical protein
VSYEGGAVSADSFPMSYRMGHRLAILAFMGGVTAYLIARTSAEVAGGVAGLLEAGVYGISAALGLKFVAGAWSGLWGAPGPGGQARG